MPEIECKLSLDTTAVDVAMKEIVRLRPSLSDASLETLHAFIDRIDAGNEVVYIASDPVLTPDTNDLVFRLELSDSFRGLMATLGAGDG